MNNQANKRIKNNGLRGQNVIEYLIVTVTVVIIVLLAANTQGGHLKNAMDNILNDTVNGIAGLRNELKFSP